ncbi:hypothetical protein SAMN06273572_103154 [Monaibacterium marinum]|uniref:Uncharacterized protein n=1 Tax=Pontivivens marinum TaxID=1690039 RepID=A0A2C9CS91_9RHOB|nr:hypothetical protein [Monaibacterium marinum]SOH94127.1 hypothetical protein SAMN06273572_103154 [Monaibacterium marinum]
MESWIGPAIIAAVVTAFFALLRDAAGDRRRRNERIRDVEAALAAEIRAYVAVLERDNLEEYGHRIGGRIMQGPDGHTGYFPFIPLENNDSIFTALISDVAMLPPTVIDWTAIYFQQVRAIAILAEDLRADAVAQLSALRKAQLYETYISMKVESLAQGQDAVALLDIHIRHGDRGVAEFLRNRRDEMTQQRSDELRDWVNSRASVRSDR